MSKELPPEYIASLRKLTGQQKWRIAFQLYWSARALRAIALRELYPEWSESKVQQRVKEIFQNLDS